MLRTVKEAAELLRVSVSSLYAMVATGEIEHHRGRGLGIKISDEQIARYLEKTTRRESEPVERKSDPRPRLRHLRL